MLAWERTEGKSTWLPFLLREQPFLFCVLLLPVSELRNTVLNLGSGYGSSGLVWLLRWVIQPRVLVYFFSLSHDLSFGAFLIIESGHSDQALSMHLYPIQPILIRPLCVY